MFAVLVYLYFSIQIKEETLSQLCSKECANCLVFRRPEPHHTTLNQTGWLKDWDVHIPFLLMAYRSAVHDTTGITPAKMMLGRDLRLPVDLLFGRPECEPTNHASDYIKALQEKLERVYDFARGHLKVKSDKMKEWYDFALEGQQLQVGDPVWLHNPQTKKGLSPKLSSPWQGPFTVTKRINDLVYRVQLRPNTKPKVVHRN